MNALLVTGMEGAANCAQALQSTLGITIEVAAGRRAALSALRKQEYDLVVVDDSLADADPSGADPLWEAIGMAQPITVNFVLSGTERVAREIRTALRRREREQENSGFAEVARHAFRVTERRPNGIRSTMGQPGTRAESASGRVLRKAQFATTLEES